MFDESFKKMAVELSEAKGSVSAAAAELGLDAGRISKWRASFNKPDFREKVEGLTEEQKRIRQLERELREVKLDRTAEAARDPKKGSTHAMPGIFSRGERNGSDL
ncbi:transposase [Dyadobacter flavalbus]|nr:transposase [Dyadobacter flavalbus]